MIESVNNEKIKEYAKLQQKKYRDEMDLFIVEGDHLVEEAEKSGIIKEIFSLDGSKGTRVTDKVMAKLSCLSSVPNVLAVCFKCQSNKASGNILILDDIQDPGNLGTIIRSAVAFGVDNIVTSLNTVDVYNMKTLRSSEGMFFHINYIRTDLEEFLTSIKDNYTIYTTNVATGKNLDKVEVKQPYAIIMGNEGSGVSLDIAKYADETLYIPMNEKCESLNVAIATSIILYEFAKESI